jgi:cell division septation protein DedD
MTLTARRSFGIGCAAAAAIGAAVLLAAPAEAHTPSITTGCADGQTTLTIDLAAYNGSHANTVSATVQPAGAAKATSLVDTTFQDSYHATFHDSKTIPSDVADTFVVTVKAWDDANGKNGWSFTKTLTAQACKKSTPPPTSSTTPTTSSTTPPATTAPTTTTSAVAATPTTTVTSVENTALANTGVNSGWLIAVAAGLLVIGAGILFALRLVARRR